MPGRNGALSERFKYHNSIRVAKNKPYFSIFCLLINMSHLSLDNLSVIIRRGQFATITVKKTYVGYVYWPEF